MGLSLEDYLNIANLFFQENNLEKSIENYEEALKLVSAPEQQIYISNTLGKLFHKTKNFKKAIDAFQLSIMLYDKQLDANLLDKAAVYNNLASAFMALDITNAIENYLQAIQIYNTLEKSDNEILSPHLANTHFAIGEAFQQQEDFYQAKTHFKQAIQIYNTLPNSNFNELKAIAHYHLGNLYTDEFNLYDAQTNYTKSLGIFKNLTDSKETKFLPYIAAVLNNLGVTFKSMGETQKALSHFEQALEEYQNLTNYDKAFFTPFVAATCNSLSILYAEMKNNQKAIAYCLETVAIYNHLADQFPEEYTHYLATSLHNLGLFYFEQKDISSAESYFKQALEIRKKLADKEPNAFDADVCATSLNLVELYQSELEKKTDLKYKKISIELLQDVTIRLQRAKENRPVIKSMLSDCTYYLNYFNTITMEELQLENAYKKTRDLTDEIHSTIHPKKKIIFQKKIVVLLEEQWRKFSENSKLKNNLADAYTNLSWMHLQLNQPKEAELTIIKTKDNVKEFPSLLCNLGHSFLLQNRWDDAKKIYLSLKDKKNEANKSYKHILLIDIEKLKNNSIKHPDFKKVKELFA